MVLVSPAENSNSGLIEKNLKQSSAAVIVNNKKKNWQKNATLQAASRSSNLIATRAAAAPE